MKSRRNALVIIAVDWFRSPLWHDSVGLHGICLPTHFLSCCPHTPLRPWLCPMDSDLGNLQPCRAVAPHVHHHWISPCSTLKANFINNLGLAQHLPTGHSLTSSISPLGSIKQAGVTGAPSNPVLPFAMNGWQKGSAERMRLCSPIIAFFARIMKRSAIKKLKFFQIFLYSVLFDPFGHAFSFLFLHVPSRRF